MPAFATIDLRQIVDMVGSHFDRSELEQYCGQCPICRDNNRLTWISQEQNQCEVCGTPIVWQNSPLWRSIYGSPDEVIRQFRAIPAVTKSGQALLLNAGLPGWFAVSDSATWQKAVEMFGELEMTRIANFVTQKKTGHPAIRYAINIAKKKIREDRPTVKAESAPAIEDKPVELKIAKEARW